METAGGAVADWQLRQFAVKQFVAPTAQVRLRLSIKDDPNNSLTEAGLDAFKISSFTCLGTCYADCNADGVRNIADFGCFQTRFALHDIYADCNNDLSLNLADFGCFQSKFALGCP